MAVNICVYEVIILKINLKTNNKLTKYKKKVLIYLRPFVKLIYFRHSGETCEITPS